MKRAQPDTRLPSMRAREDRDDKLRLRRANPPPSGVWYVWLNGTRQRGRFGHATARGAIGVWRRQTGQRAHAGEVVAATPAPAAEAPTAPWYILTIARDKTTHNLGEGPFDDEAEARRFAKNEVGASWVLFQAAPGTADAFEAEKDCEYAQRRDDADPRTDWYILKRGAQKRVVPLGEGPFTSLKLAKEFAKAEYAGPVLFFLAPAGTADAFEAARDFYAAGPR